MRRMTLCAAALALVLAGCEVRAEISVNNDGSGTFGFVFGMEPLFFGTLPSSANPLVDVQKELKKGPLPWQVTTFKEPGLQGIRATLPFNSLEDLREMLREQADSEEEFSFGPQGGFEDDDLVIEKVAGGWSMRMTGRPPASDTFGDVPPDIQLPEPDLSGLPDIDKILRFEFNVTLPGDPESHNADEVKTKDGRSTFIWRSGFFDTKQVSLRAQTVPAGSGFPWFLLLAALVLLGGGALFVKKRMPAAGPPPVVLEGLPTAAAMPLAPVEEPVGAPVPEQPSLLSEMGLDFGDEPVVNGSANGHASNGAVSNGSLATLVMPDEPGADEPPISAEG